MRLIGYSNRTRYWQQYAFAHAPKGYAYTRGLDFPFHLFKIWTPWLVNTKWFLPLGDVRLFHTYNGVVANAKPWVVEVESRIPRYGDLSETSALYRFGMERLRSRHCKKIIYTSECTRRMNEEALSAQGISPEKSTVMYRAVEQYTPLSGESESFNVLFVGNGFYRKGGPELLEAFSRIKRTDLRLVIVSSFEVDWAVLPTKEEEERVRCLIDGDRRITVHSGLPHDSVIEEMRKAHVYVQPTFADTFNNTIMEAMGCGLPVIATNVRAIPEFVLHEKNGFVIEVDQGARAHVADEIEHYLRRLIDDDTLRESMGKASREMTEAKFAIETRNRKLKQIYDEALA